MWKLTIGRTVGSDPNTITRESETGFNWEHHGNGMWEFSASDGTWTGVYALVKWFTEELLDGTDDGTGDMTAQAPPAVTERDQALREALAEDRAVNGDGYEGGF